MSHPKPSEQEEATGAELAGESLDLDGLAARGDVEGLLTLARAYRSGSAPGGRDMKRCLDAYRAAASLGSADAEYAVALFCMTGNVVTQDFKEGAAHLRAAAEKGSVPAKVYLGNLYELGIHYKADPEKADVWYRNAARGAQVESAPDDPDYARELAELGCARYVLTLVEGGSTTEEDKARLLARARAHGYGLRSKDEPLASDTSPDRPTFLNALKDADDTKGGQAKAPGAVEPEARVDARREEDQKKTTPKRDPSAGPSQTSLAFGAFAYALLFAITGVGAAFAATLGAREVIAHGHPLPGLGERTDLVFPIVLFLVGILPNWLVYRFTTLLKGLVIGAALGGVGWVAWGTGQASLHAERSVQAIAFGLAGLLGGLLVLGLLGGTKKQPRARAKR